MGGDQELIVLKKLNSYYLPFEPTLLSSTRMARHLQFESVHFVSNRYHGSLSSPFTIYRYFTLHYFSRYYFKFF